MTDLATEIRKQTSKFRITAEGFRNRPRFIDSREIADVLTQAADTIDTMAAEIQRLRNGLIAIKTSTDGSGRGTTADGANRIAFNTLYPKEANDN